MSSRSMIIDEAYTAVKRSIRLLRTIADPPGSNDHTISILESLADKECQYPRWGDILDLYSILEWSHPFATHMTIWHPDRLEIPIEIQSFVQSNAQFVLDRSDEEGVQKFLQGYLDDYHGGLDSRIIGMFDDIFGSDLLLSICPLIFSSGSTQEDRISQRQNNRNFTVLGIFVARLKDLPRPKDYSNPIRPLFDDV